MSNPHFFKKTTRLNLKLVVLIFCFYFFFPTIATAQIETDPGHRSWGKTRDGRYAICQTVSFVNRDTVAVCNPQMKIDLSNYPSILDITVTNLSSSGFDINDMDTSPTGFSASNLTGNVIDPTTTKCVEPGRGVYFVFTVYADPTVWGDNTSYAWGSTITGVNPVEGNQTATDSDSSPEMYDSDVILGGALEVYQSGIPLGYNAFLDPNLDGTYDFTYRITIGNYDNDTNTGGPATNIFYTDELNAIFDVMPINSIAVSNSANGNLTANSSYNGGAATVGGVSVTPDINLITTGSLNPDEEDYVEITMNVGPIIEFENEEINGRQVRFLEMIMLVTQLKRELQMEQTLHKVRSMVLRGHVEMAWQCPWTIEHF